MQFKQPAQGECFEIGEMVHFIATVPAGTGRVIMEADDQFALPDAVIHPTATTTDEATCALNQTFLGRGQRSIKAKAFSAAGELLGSATVKIDVEIPQIGSYTPPFASLDALGNIVRHLEDARTKRIVHAFEGKKVLFQLSEKQFYLDSKLDLDTDGSTLSEGSTHQDDTSLHQMDGHSPIDSNSVPYYVLPLHSLFFDNGVRMGDIAAVIYGDALCFALFADEGPASKIGEGSIALHRALGFERVRSNGSVEDVGIDENVITVIFPGSGASFMNEARTALSLPIDEVKQHVVTKGRELFTALGGTVD